MILNHDLLCWAENFSAPICNVLLNNKTKILIRIILKAKVYLNERENIFLKVKSLKQYLNLY